MNIRALLLDNWGIKLVSLALSLTLWLYVTSKGKSELTLPVPLELRNIPRGMALVGDVPGSIDVRVQGQERALRDITTGKKVFGILDLSLARAGENSIRISPDDIRRPAGVLVTHLSLSEIKVRLEPLVRKTFRLRPVLHGSPARGYRLGTVAVFPSRVTLEGPQGLIAALDRLQTMPIDVEGAAETITIEPKIDYQGQPMKLLDHQVTIRITIERARQ